jgi:hypothetical protein
MIAVIKTAPVTAIAVHLRAIDICQKCHLLPGVSFLIRTGYFIRNACVSIRITYTGMGGAQA